MHTLGAPQTYNCQKNLKEWRRDNVQFPGIGPYHINYDMRMLGTFHRHAIQSWFHKLLTVQNFFNRYVSWRTNCSSSNCIALWCALHFRGHLTKPELQWEGVHQLHASEYSRIGPILKCKIYLLPNAILICLRYWMGDVHSFSDSCCVLQHVECLVCLLHRSILR